MIKEYFKLYSAAGGDFASLAAASFAASLNGSGGGGLV